MEGPRRARPARGRQALLVWLLPALVLAFGIPGDLPWTLRPDEFFFLEIGRKMAANGDPSPHWFGHPGSTLIYPLAAIRWVQQRIFGSDALATAALAGRVLAAAYAWLCFPLAHHVARRLFDARVALLSVWLMLLAPYALAHGTWLRTDGPGSFFVLLAFAACLRLHERPGSGRALAAGVAVGVATGSRWFGAATAVLLAWPLPGRGLGARRAAQIAGAGALGALFGFAASTPYALLEIDALRRSVSGESLKALLGADGLSPLGNLGWYLGYALPRLGGGVHAALAVAGLVSVVARGSRAQRGIPLLFAALLAGTSLHPLHWMRWTLPLFPFLCMLAAHALDACGRAVARRARSPRTAYAALVALASLWPLAETALHLVREARPSTLSQARVWARENLPAGALVVQEFAFEPRVFTAPLDATRLVVVANRGSLRCESLPARAQPAWVMITAAYYRRVFSEAKRHPKRVACYERLFERGALVQSFPAGPLRGGPTLHVYRLPAAEPGRQAPPDLGAGVPMSWRERLLFD